MRFSLDLSLTKTNHVKVNYNRYKMMQQHRWTSCDHTTFPPACFMSSTFKNLLRPIVIPKQKIKNGTISHFLIPETYMSVVHRKTMFYAQP